MTDNSTALSYINRLAGVRSILCNNVTTEIWEFCIKRGVYISTAHISRKENSGSTIKKTSRFSWVNALLGSLQISGGIIPSTGYWYVSI